MSIEIEPIGYVQGPRAHPEDDYWGDEEARITLAPQLPAESLQGLAEFSHAEILFHLHRVDPARIETGARHPRNNKHWPAVGIFAQRGKSRPNRIASTICRIVAVEGRTLIVSELDAIDGTPVLDIKPVMQECLPRDPVRQPEWAHQLMRHYWLTRDEAERHD
jgi:tRNA (adenine37-N6)-methyltransferase